jgi:hypothetical protein
MANRMPRELLPPFGPPKRQKRYLPNNAPFELPRHPSRWNIRDQPFSRSMFSEHGIDALQHPKNVGILTKTPSSFVLAAR